MKPSGAIRYPVQGVTLHRVAAGKRSQGDGQEQVEAPSSLVCETGNSVSGETAKQKPTLHTVEEKAKTEGKPLDRKTKSEPKLSLGGKKEGGGPRRLVSEKYLPEVADIAHKLTKVSVMSTPDTHLLNTPPKDMQTKRMIPVLPSSPSGGVAAALCAAAREGSTSLYTQKRKEPKFVPYEPYKGCVKPIFTKKKTKVVQQEAAGKSVPAVSEEKDSASKTEPVADEQKTTEKLNIMVKDFERERASWEEQTKVLIEEKKSMEEQLSQMKKDKTNLENQLKIQSQVNAELKKLLVASVGEDVQGQVQVLTEDKARMATMIRRYSERVDRDYEEKERMEIQCDVWRSKFLGSSMLVDELAGWKAALMRHIDEAEEALHVMMDEHDMARQHVLNMYRMNKQLRDAFDPLAAQSGGVASLTSADLVTLAVDGDVLAETVRDRLLGDLGRAVGCGLSVEGLETQTPGEKMARQVLGWRNKDGRASCEGCSTVSPGRNAMMHRFHPNTRYEHVTVNCCAHCNGEIKVV